MQADIIIVLIITITLLFFLYYTSFSLWLMARAVGVCISLKQLFLIRVRRIPPQEIVACMADAKRADLKGITCDKLQAHYLAGGHITNVVDAMRMASFAGLDLKFTTAATVDLAGQNISEVVRILVDGRDKETPAMDINNRLMELMRNGWKF